MMRAFQDGHHVLLSSEEFDKPEVNTRKFRRALQQSWNPPPTTYAIVYYRRFYDFFLSVYNQSHKHKVDPFESFVTWTTNSRIDEMLQMYTMATKERFEKGGFDHVEVVPMNDLDGIYKDVNTRFFCEYVPGANRTCQWLKSHPAPSANSGTQNLEYNRLYYFARAQGFPLKQQRDEQVIAKIKNKLDTMGTGYRDSVSVCLSSSIQQRLLDLSLSFEEKFACARPGVNVRDLNCTVGVQNLKLDFASKVKSNTFCSLNTELIMASEQWTKFFWEQ